MKKYINNKDMKKLVVAVFSIGLSLTGMAQQSPLSNFYNFNEFIINPAQAGYRNQLEGSASHRLQWQGIEGAPTTTFIGAHGAINEKMGLGLKIMVDQTDILQQFAGSFAYAYRVKLNDKARLNFGIAAMALQNSIQYSKAVIGNYADEVITGGDQEGMTFDAEIGLMLEYSNLKLGIASSHLFESGVDYDLPENRGSATFERVRLFTSYASYYLEISDNWDVEPFVLVRNQGVESFQMEINALTSYRQTLFLGAGYRQDAGYIGRVGFQLSDQLMAAYAYEFSNSGVASYSSGSHEFMLGYKLNRPKDGMNKKNKVKEELSPEPVTQQVEELIEEKVEEKIEEEEVEEEPAPQVVERVQREIEEEPIVEEAVVAEPVSPVSPVEINSAASEELPEEVFEKDIKFDFESTTADPNKLANNENLNKIADYLKRNPGKKILIKGHTCNMGTDAVNRKVSLQRANTVKDYLSSKGVASNQMEVKAMLDSEPLVPNSSIPNRQKNRRVEIEMMN